MAQRCVFFFFWVKLQENDKLSKSGNIQRKLMGPWPCHDRLVVPSRSKIKEGTKQAPSRYFYALSPVEVGCNPTNSYARPYDCLFEAIIATHDETIGCPSRAEVPRPSCLSCTTRWTHGCMCTSINDV